MVNATTKIWEVYMRCLFDISVFSVFILPCNVFAGERESFSQSVDLAFSVNIEPPVCKLENTVQSIDFGDLSVQEIKESEIKKTATFSFTGCASVDSLKISFIGDNVDNNKNYIKNKIGADYASGIAIKLYDESFNKITLKDGYSRPVGKLTTSFDFLIYASIEKESVNSSIQPGIVDTSVLFSVTYN
ncbi:TPA: type 1 fimbrial protein [Escherichia coli]|uniref:fimbrial protein n=1 Tax=Escherichia coli TaxID=562 RepID=UPI0019B6F6AE|nr:fimbrial protein [Escherichia coli]EEY6643839.1 type 1 fimbrial protein [Escherichia coli]MCX3440785.1 type 1 fimbrial protein [Escherichia coli]HAL7525775.1 type 1 fimbrial protein [Escherichia coli]